jgi:hypothetical protein
MKKTSALTLLLSWVKSTEMFSRPSRRVPGKWHLYEFYYEPEGQLIHVDEEGLKFGNLEWEIILNPQGHFSQQSSVPVKILDGLSNCRWSLSGNYIKLIHPVNDSEHEEVQFAVVNDNLRLLKKETDGTIRFFGFFRRVESYG